MRPSRLLMPCALASALLLAACYSSSEPLFEVSEGRLPLAEGTYRGASGDTIELVKFDGDHYHATTSDGTNDLILVPLAERGAYIAEAVGDDGATYSIVRVGPGGFRLMTLDCSKAPERDAAAGLADTIDSDECAFGNAGRLTAAITRLLQRKLPDRWESYTPVAE